MKTKILASLALFVLTNSTMASQGIIKFSGSIIESPCKVSQKNGVFTASCYRKGVIQTKKIFLNKSFETLPFGVGKVLIRNFENVKLVTIQYQ